MTTPNRLDNSAGLMPVQLPAHELPDRRGVFACFSNIERIGRWALPRRFRTLSVFGSVTLDLTAVELGPETDIEIRCFFANVEVIVPPSVRLEVEGDATVGNFEVTRQVASTDSPHAPFVRIRAGVFFGNIEISVIDPNAKSFFQKLKARWKLRDTDPS
ncbi:MAG TPA: LiaF domain-containing protein [Gemmatimonas sp.]|nr:LiaF domain-containing protein [Gemmatimonas sp.]